MLSTEVSTGKCVVGFKLYFTYESIRKYKTSSPPKEIENIQKADALLRQHTITYSIYRKKN